MTIRLLNSSRTKEALKIFRTGFFSSGTRCGVRQNRHRRRLKTRTGGVLECFSLSLSGAIFHSAGQNATFCICVAYFVINTQGCSAGVFTQAPINNPSVWRGGQGLRGATNKERKQLDDGATSRLFQRSNHILELTATSKKKSCGGNLEILQFQQERGHVDGLREEPVTVDGSGHLFQFNHPEPMWSSSLNLSRCEKFSISPRSGV